MRILKPVINIFENSYGARYIFSFSLPVTSPVSKTIAYRALRHLQVHVCS